MKYAQTKFDWFYEFRPAFIIFFGALGLMGPASASSYLQHLSQVCGVVLLALATKIVQWRYRYRKNIQS
jgi:hypothetical protein